MLRQSISILLMVVLASCVEAQLRIRPGCGLMTSLFKNRNCVDDRKFPCGWLDFNMKLLDCYEFACENYREIETFCTANCGALQIVNGLCSSGTSCCLDVSDTLDTSKLRPVPNTKGFAYDA